MIIWAMHSVSVSYSTVHAPSHRRETRPRPVAEVARLQKHAPRASCGRWLYPRTTRLKAFTSSGSPLDSASTRRRQTSVGVTGSRSTNPTGGERRDFDPSISPQASARLIEDEVEYEDESRRVTSIAWASPRLPTRVRNEE
ncbi:MAG: hypothetical protein CMJ18_09805 [Phycisphaeraceae bacterium]|nr:hypothetical protein [Phycisphaeraceae bacterium]